MGTLSLLPKGKADDDGFETFWELYPRRVAKGQARRAWARLRPNAELRGRIYDGVRRSAAYWNDQGTEKQFIPHPATWLNAERWEDELEETDPWA